MATGSRAAAPADVFHAAAVTPTLRRWGMMMPCPPNAAAERMMAPRLRGSVTPSHTSRKGLRSDSNASRGTVERRDAKATTPWWPSVRAAASGCSGVIRLAFLRRVVQAPEGASPDPDRESGQDNSALGSRNGDASARPPITVWDTERVGFGGKPQEGAARLRFGGSGGVAMRRGTHVAVVVLAGALSGATLGCTSKEVASDDHKTALRELTNVAAGLEIEAEPSPGARSDYATCLYTGVEELEAKYDANVPPLADMLTDYWQKNEPVEAGSLREALVGGGATPEEVDDLFANCGPAPADESESYSG